MLLMLVMVVWLGCWQGLVHWTWKCSGRWSQPKLSRLGPHCLQQRGSSCG